ncbi:MAG: hypothetical protein IH613_02445 [Desulfuromonadales bacterium]|nr:hypothetical protein [Desulfuromonadales bacterium]
MPGLKVLLTLIGLAMLGAAGCSPLHTEIDLSYRWSTVSAVTLEAPAQDPWKLAPVMRQELQDLGYVLTLPESGTPDLIVRFDTQDARDLTREGLLVIRPKSLHVQLVDPGSDTLLAVADYFMRSDEDPATGMRTALAGLFQRILKADSSPPTMVRSQSQEPIPAQEKRLESESPSDKATATISPAAGNNEPKSTQPGAIADPQPVTVPAIGDAEPMVRPLKQSPWAPRFKSWGFADWGKADDAER